MIPYDSDADQWPCTKQGERAHWGLIIGVAMILPYRNKAFDEAQMLDGYVSHLKPPLSSKVCMIKCNKYFFGWKSQFFQFGYLF